MNNPTEVCNQALLHLDELRIGSLSEDSTKAGIFCREFYPQVRREVLRDGFWGFAASRASLAQSTTAPDFGFDHAYPLPTDCLRLLLVNGRPASAPQPGVEHSVERHAGARAILSDEDVMQIVYTADVEDTTQWDPLFTSAVIYSLAAKLAVPLDGSATVAQNLERKAEAALAGARVVAGAESNATEFSPAALLRRRSAGLSYRYDSDTW